MARNGSSNGNRRKAGGGSVKTHKIMRSMECIQSLDQQGLSRGGVRPCARAVIRGETKGYKNHPQLDRLFSHRTPLAGQSMLTSHQLG